jgi:predicted nucleic acid-binding protein
VTRQVAVIDASAVVDLLAGGSDAVWIAGELSGCDLWAPAHLAAEVFSALGRQHRSGVVTDTQVERALGELVSLEVGAHPVRDLLLAAWRRRDNLALSDALYVELAARLDTVVITTDRRLARATPLAVAPPG